MKYLKFTYVDAVTGVSVASEPARNGPVFPPIIGLEFAWARESAYPTTVPEFFGICPDASDTQIDGVLGLFVESDWEQMRIDEMNARNPPLTAVARAQGKAALIGAGMWSGVLAFVAAIQDPTERALAEVALHDTQTWQRNSPFLNSAKVGLGLTDDQLDALFAVASGIEL